MEKIEQNGKKWSYISRFIPGRTENSVKNRFFSILKMSTRKYCSDEEIFAKLSSKIKEIKNSFYSSTNKLFSFNPILGKNKNDFSLNDLSISSPSFVLAQKFHKRRKNKALTNFYDKLTLGNSFYNKKNPILVGSILEQEQANPFDNQKKMVSLRSNRGSIIFDSIADIAEEENDAFEYKEKNILRPEIGI